MYEWMLPAVSKKQGQPDLPSVLDMSKSLLGVKIAKGTGCR